MVKSKAYLDTVYDMNFHIKVKNYAEKTTFYGEAWKQFTRLYQIDVGSELVFDLTNNNKHCMVAVPNLPILPPSKIMWFICVVL